MLGLLGLIGAVLAGVMVDSQAPTDEDSNSTDAHDDDDARQSDGGDLNNIFHMLSTRDDAASAKPFEPNQNTEQDGVISSNDEIAAKPEDLWLNGTDLAEMLGGDAGHDLISGNGGGDALTGYAGNDSLNGGDGDDAIHGGSGGDSLLGGSGADLLHGEAGNDTLSGGIGDDALQGCDGDDGMSGDAGADSLHGGQGNDILHGDAGDDALDGGYGNDQLTGGSGSDTLDGGDGNDTIWGQTEADPDLTPDFLNGGAGNDTLMLGAGDYGNGGEGADDFQLFDITKDDPPMQITDFNPQEDSLVVVYDANLHPHPKLTAEVSTDGTTLLLDGVPLANLLHLSDLDLSTVALQTA